MIYILRPTLFFAVWAALFVYGNSLDPKTLDDWQGYFLLACVPLFGLGWWIAPARILWLASSMRDKAQQERLIKRNQVFGWALAWGIINLTLLIVSQTDGGFWRQFFRH